MMKQRAILKSNKSFTIVEVLISITILVLIFVFLYGQFNLAFTSTSLTTQKQEKSYKRLQVIELLYKDLFQSTNITYVPKTKYDLLTLQSTNSLHGFSSVFVKWVVVKGDDVNSLVRIESNQNFSLESTIQDYYMDVVLEDIQYFKVININKIVEVFINAKTMKDIHFKFQVL